MLPSAVAGLAKRTKMFRKAPPIGRPQSNPGSEICTDSYSEQQIIHPVVCFFWNRACGRVGLSN